MSEHNASENGAYVVSAEIRTLSMTKTRETKFNNSVAVVRGVVGAVYDRP